MWMRTRAAEKRHRDLLALWRQEFDEVKQLVTDQAQGEQRRVELVVAEQARREQQRDEEALAGSRRARTTKLVAAGLAFLGLLAGLILYLPAIAGPPNAKDPGRIGVALVGHGDKFDFDKTIFASMDIDAAAESSTRFTLAITDLSGSLSEHLQVVIIVCGQIRSGLTLREVNGGKDLRLVPFEGSSSRIGADSRLGDRAQCGYTVSTAVGVSSHVLIRGESPSPIATRSGEGLLYSAPGLTTTPVYDELAGLSLWPLAGKSVLNVRLSNTRPDLLVDASAPQVPPSGQLEWNTPVSGGDLANQYRVLVTLASERRAIQGRIFAAGSLVGFAGAAVLWWVEATMESRVDRKVSRRADQSKMPVKEGAD